MSGNFNAGKQGATHSSFTGIDLDSNPPVSHAQSSYIEHTSWKPKHTEASQLGILLSIGSYADDINCIYWELLDGVASYHFTNLLYFQQDVGSSFGDFSRYATLSPARIIGSAKKVRASEK